MRSSLVCALTLVGCFCIAQGHHSFFEKPQSVFVKPEIVHRPEVHVVNVHHSAESVESVEFVEHYHSCSRKNEVFYPCLPSCAITCANLFRSCRTAKRNCVGITNGGCDCAYGYARLTSRGPCVSTKYCEREPPRPDPEPKCRRHEEYTDCGRTCDEKCDARTESCSTRCKTGCFCKKGYVRIDGDCVKRSECSTCDPITEVHKDCGYACSEDCDDRACLTDRRACKSGCFCKPGYRRIHGVCRPESTCPAAPHQCTSTNEVFTTGFACKELCTPGATCGTGQQETRCFCKVGFKRINGLCQDERLCPTIPEPERCPNANEERSSCSNPCVDECTRSRTCDAATGCTRNLCICAPGFKRISGVCVPQSQCSTQCRANESFRAGSSCDQSCRPNGVVCSTGQELGCWCDAGFILVGNVCVRGPCPDASLIEV